MGFHNGAAELIVRVECIRYVYRSEVPFASNKGRMFSLNADTETSIPSSVIRKKNSFYIHCRG